ncbi:hypothetical protein BDZ97DRAFT_1806129 [Flammula alnicola]|nr:hypothetical protein BDZ97DRAFT_1806129 [Flammula alnicola]
MNDEHSAVTLCKPIETLGLNLDSGESKAIWVYFDPVKKKYLLKCDFCGKFLVLNAQKSTLKLQNHRDTSKE